jgi:membrane protein YqaA with SNARE-associated domain
MKLWFTIIFTFIVQELVTTNAVLLQAYEQEYNGWIIFLIFLAATTFIISLGFFLGKFVQKRFAQSKVVVYTERKVRKLESMVGKTGKRVALVSLGFANFNYINAFIASWLSLSFREVFVYLFIGDLLWYILNSLMILGVHTYIQPKYAMIVSFGISIGIFAVSALLHKKVANRLAATA